MCLVKEKGEYEQTIDSDFLKECFDVRAFPGNEVTTAGTARFSQRLSEA
jgi:hypothetical protein